LTYSLLATLLSFLNQFLQFGLYPRIYPAYGNFAEAGLFYTVISIEALIEKRGPVGMTLTSQDGCRIFYLRKPWFNALFILFGSNTVLNFKKGYKMGYVLIPQVKSYFCNIGMFQHIFSL